MGYLGEDEGDEESHHYEYDGSPKDDHQPEEEVDSKAEIKRIKWDKRMRLTISKDFRNEVRRCALWVGIGPP